MKLGIFVLVSLIAVAATAMPAYYQQRAEFGELCRDAASQDVASIRKYLERIPEESRVFLASQPGYKGVPPLAYACLSRNIDLARLLLEAGADTESPMPNGDRPLNIAVKAGDQEIVSLLLKAGADANGNGQYGLQPLHICEVVALMKMLVDYGADVHSAENIYNQTPLCRASSADIVKYLLDQGADPNGKPGSRRYPLHKAQDVECAKLLIEAGADINRTYFKNRI